MKQKFIKLGSIEVPIVIDEGKEWFPISYITTKVLKRSGKNSLLTKKKKEELKDHLKILSVEFGDNNIQEANEYFGLYIPSSYGKNSRVTAYIDKTHDKIERYKQLSGYKFLFFYPEDVEHDYQGCREKIQKIKENPMFSML